MSDAVKHVLKQSIESMQWRLTQAVSTMRQHASSLSILSNEAEEIQANIEQLKNHLEKLP